MGFASSLGRGEVRRRVTSRLRNVLSAAFLSRIGTPIVFDPLAPAAMAAILGRAIVSAVRTGAGRLGLNATVVCEEENVGAAVLAVRRPEEADSGARGLLELGRHLATEALLEMPAFGNKPAPCTLRVSAGTDGKITIHRLEGRPNA